MMHHRHEKRFGVLKQNLSGLSCAWAKVCGPVKPDHLLFEMEKRYCIKCNREHWFFLKQIQFEPQPQFDPNEYWTSELEEMGFFRQFDESNSE
jgi:hypothetical protein